MYTRCGEDAKTGILAKHRRLVVAMCVYAALLVSFFSLWQSSSVAKYIVVILGVVLAALISELTSKDHLRARIILICAPAVGAALVQLSNDRLTQKGLRDMEIRRTKDQVILDREARLQEEVVLDPVEAVGAMDGADVGFRIKAARLSLRIANREARLIHDQPDLGGRILTFPDQPTARLQAYRSLHDYLLHSPEGRAHSAPQINEIIHFLEQQYGYLTAAATFRREVKTRYLRIEVSNKAISSDVCRELADFSVRLLPVSERYRVAGVYNHLGNLAMACGWHEEAMADFYHGLSLDSEHITMYESLAYALWIIDKDSRSALTYADLGRTVCSKEAIAITAEFEEAQRLYKEAARKGPENARLIGRAGETLDRFFHNSEEMFQKAISNLKERLAMDYCYFSALELKNETEARQLMATLFASHRQDGDFQDSMGFVLMRFANTNDEWNEAKRLFKQAVQNPKSGSTTQRLASTHLEELTMAGR